MNEQSSLEEQLDLKNAGMKRAMWRINEAFTLYKGAYDRTFNTKDYNQ